jgi:hypothetical protein
MPHLNMIIEVNHVGKTKYRVVRLDLTDAKTFVTALPAWLRLGHF